MNLAYRDIRHNLGRFLLTAVGIGLLLMTVMGMSGIYRGIVEDAILLIDRVESDLWVVQKDTHGPFAEVSRVPASLARRIEAIRGVESANAFVSSTVQRELGGERSLRAVVQGLSWPEDRGEWLPLQSGRALQQAHYEMIADRSLGLTLGERVPLGNETFVVVGITSNMVSSGGDGMAFLTLRDAQDIQYERSPEAIRLERLARRGRADTVDIAHTQPALTARAAGPASYIPAIGPASVSAVLVKVSPGTSVSRVSDTISAWPEVSVYSKGQQQGFLLEGSVDRARRQVGLFRVLLVAVSGIIMALIIYTLTLDKTHDIALLKLLGARNGVVFGLILQQAVLLGGIGYVVAYVSGQWIFPYFPRRVIVQQGDLVALAGAVAAISICAGMLGVWKAMKVRPGDVLA